MSFQMPPNTILTSKAFSSAEVYNIIVLTYTIKHIFTEKEYTILLLSCLLFSSIATYLDYQQDEYHEFAFLHIYG